MEIVRSLVGAAVRAVGLSRLIAEEEFKQWRRESLDPAIKSGACYVPMPGFEDSRHYRDKQNRHHLGRYEWALRVLKSRRRPVTRVLDCACGSGYGSAILSRVADRVDSVDRFGAAIRLARSRYSRPNIHWHEVDAGNLRNQFEGESFDAIVSFQTIECIEDDHRLLDDFRCLLKPGGVLLIDTPVRKQRIDRPQNPHHLRNYATDEWIDLLLKRFDTVLTFDALPERTVLERLGMPSKGSVAVCERG